MFNLNECTDAPVYNPGPCMSLFDPACLCGQVNYDGELHKHPQLEADLAAVRDLYGHHAVSLRYLTVLSLFSNRCENITLDETFLTQGCDFC